MKNLISNRLLRRLSKVLAVAMGTLMLISVAVLQAALNFAPAVNDFLNATTYRVEKDENSTEDTNYFPAEYDSVEEVSAYADEAALEIEREGLVLLRNEGGALPLGEDARSVTLFGQGSVALNYATSGSSATDSSNYADFKTVLESRGFRVNQTLWDRMKSNDFKSYIRNFNTVNSAPWSFYEQSESSFAGYGDAAIVVFARNSGEGADVPVAGSDGEDGSYLSLTANERILLENLTSLKGEGVFDRIVVLLNSAVMMQLDFLTENPAIDVDAALWIGNLGRVGAYAVADVLKGEVNPSGRLPDTYLKDNFSSPAMATWNRAANGFAEKYQGSGVDISSLGDYGARYYAVYAEGVYVGYRYYETRYEDFVLDRGNAGAYEYDAEVAYPFGYGMSYTTFEYSQFAVTEKENGYEVSVTVKNTGETAGKETVQIYAQKAYDPDDGVEKAAVELVGFDKTALLTAGASETVNVFVSKEQFKSYDSEGYGTYILSAGDYYLATGRDAHEALNNILAAKGNTPENTQGRMDAEGESTLAARVLTLAETDAETYSRSVETGNPITNQLDFMDLNRYEHRGANSVTYVSRSDWTGTFPEGRITVTIDNADMLYDLSTDKPIDNTGATAPSYGKQNGLSLAMLRNGPDRIESGEIINYDDKIWQDLLDQMTFEEQALLVTRCAYNTPTISSVNKPATKDQDSPTAFIQSLTGASFPSEGIWAASFNEELIAKVGDALAEDVRLAGYHGIYAPGINIHRTPFGGRTHEYFSEDPFLSAMSCVAEIGAMHEKGVIPVLKHYAFNNEETERGGIGIWMNEQEAREIMLLPFEYATRPSIGNAHAIMTSFNRAGCIWTSASPELMIEITRNEWAFDGYSITDMADSFGGSFMKFSDGIINGTDCFLSSSGDPLNDFRDDPAFQQRMREASHRILYVIGNYSSAMNGLASTDRVILIMPWWQAVLIAAVSVTAAVTAVSALWWICCEIADGVNKKKTKAE